MKDQKELLKKCLVNDTPAIVFQGTDSCALEILQAAEAIYRKNGCSPEFLHDFQENVVGNFKAYQKGNSEVLKLPDLTEGEKEVQKYFQEETIKSLPNEIQAFEQSLKQNGFLLINERIVEDGGYILNNNKEYCTLIGKNKDYEFAINHNKDANKTSYFIFSNDCNIPERIGDYIDFKACFSEIMYKHPLHQKKDSELRNLIKQYEILGYPDISKAIEQYSLSFENISNNSNFKYTIGNVHVCNNNSKELKGTISIYNTENMLMSELTNLSIHDKATGKIEPLHTGDIDLCSQPPESIKKLLSGNKVEMKNKLGLNKIVGLNKTATGWGISIAKQTFNVADSSAGI